MPLVFRAGATTAPPPRRTETEVDAWAHCIDPRCEGYGQQPVKGIRELVEHTIASRTGETNTVWANVVENTNEYLRFARDTDVPCPVCSRDREITAQERPTYPIITGFPQDGLLSAPKYNPEVRNTEADQQQAAEMAQMRKELAELRGMLTAKQEPESDAVG